MPVKPKSARPAYVSIWLLVALVAMGATAVVAATPAPTGTTTTWNRTLPIGADWAIDRGIDLPNPFGVSAFLVYMSRDIEVYDVRVTLPNDDPQSISDAATFGVRNHTALAAAKIDAWILPIFNVYGLVGHTWTDTSLDAVITIDRIIGDPIVVEVTQDSEVGGPLLGFGGTLVAGAGPWFIMLDGNYNHSAIDVFEGGIAAWFLSGRTGWSGKAPFGSWRAWLGAAYLASDRTLTVEQDVRLLGTIVVDVDQRPVNPLTLQAGGSVSIGRRWDVLLELGSNFDDAFVGVFSAAYRF